MTALADRAVRAPATTVSVVICSYTMKRWQLLGHAVESVRRQDAKAHEIIVVVDFAPELLDLVRSEMPDVIAVPNYYAQGLSGARNTGIEAATGEIVAFLDDDATADTRWLRETASAYGADVLGVGGRVVPAWAGRRPAWFPTEFDWVVGCSYTGLPTGPATVRNFIGANMSFRRDVLIEAGGFTEGLGRLGSQPLGCEETELCLRVANRWPDGSLRYEPAAYVRHHVPRERSQWSYFRARCYAEGVSKAAVAKLAGPAQALSSERAYVRSVLPAGFATAVRQAGREPAGLFRAAAIVLGLLITSTGYLSARWQQARLRRAETRSRFADAAAGVLRQALALVPLLVVGALWASSLRSVDLDAMNDLGLVSVLPFTYWAALVLLLINAVRLVCRGGREWLIACHVVALIFILHATPTLLYDSLRYSWGWKHVGIVDYVVRHGGVDPHIAQLPVYHAWPGFFTVNAVLGQAGGLASSLSYAAWGPPVFELLDLGPLLLLFGTLTADRRRIWAAVLVYYLTAWVGQDYFSPQAFAFFLYLVAVVVVLRYLEPTPRRLRGAALRRGQRVQRFLHGGPLRRQQITGTQRRMLLVFVVLGMVAVASSHQLTPLALTGALGVLVAIRAGGPRWLPWLMLAITAGWIAWLGRTYVAANIESLMRAFGALQSNAQTGFVQLDKASFEQQLVDWTDRTLTAAIWPAAAAGFWLQWRYGRRDMIPALLALVPVPLLFANDYGGEILFRVCLFALPFLAFLISGLVQRRDPEGPVHYVQVSADAGPQSKVVTQRPRPALMLTVIMLLAALFMVAYDGKERMNYFTPQERAASNWLYKTAPKGALMDSINSNYPWAFTHYEYYEYDFLEYLPPAQRRELVTHPAAVLERFLAAGCDRPAYLILTRSQGVEVRYTASLDPRAVGRISAAARSDVFFQLAYYNRDAAIYRVRPGACTDGAGR